MKRVLIAIAALAALYTILAYIVLPALWTHHERQPRLADRPMLTATRQGIPGDPINVGFVGDREDIIRVMQAFLTGPRSPAMQGPGSPPRSMTGTR
jgi:hypothetical protein